jgi:putative membrane protein
MRTVAQVLVFAIALVHLWILVLEMFLWTKPAGLKRFRLTPEKAAVTAVLAKNQGLYNGFLAAGLLWALLGSSFAPTATFFLLCVLAAGLYGGVTASRSIFVVQALPAALALGAVWLSR